MTAEEVNDVAENAAATNLENNGDEWLDPEDEADTELSYWEDDEGSID